MSQPAQILGTLVSGGVESLPSLLGLKLPREIGEHKVGYLGFREGDGHQAERKSSGFAFNCGSSVHAIAAAGSIFIINPEGSHVMLTTYGTRCEPVQHLENPRPDSRWESVTKRINSFAKLDPDWDGYGTGPIGQPAIGSALAIIRAAQDTGMWKFTWANPTSEDGILMQLAQPGGVTMKLEVGEEGDIGAMVKRPGSEPEFFDIPVDDLEEFFAQQSNDPTV
jgi:hypothetical protein